MVTSFMFALSAPRRVREHPIFYTIKNVYSMTVSSQNMDTFMFYRNNVRFFYFIDNVNLTLLVSIIC